MKLLKQKEVKMDPKKRLDVKVGLKVNIVLKADQRTGKLTQGVVKDILTNQTITFKNLKDAAFNCSEDLFNVQNNQAKINNAIADRITKKKQAN